MKFPAILVPALIGSIVLHAAEVPKALSYLPANEFVKGATTVVVPPAELDKYVAMVEEAARKDPDWFEEHQKKAPPGVPLPFDPKLGLTKEQYDEYLELWGKREFKAVDAVILQLKEGSDKKWAITVVMPNSDGSSPISTLKYDPEADAFVSPNGTLKRLEDVNADKNSILGEWSGHEWKFEEETPLGKTKENFAIGKTGDGKFGLLVYRMQEVSSEGTRLFDKSLVIRFPLGEAGILKVPAPKR
ncbi:hypothetical protein HAHE_37070 [Haloferula helveola]|uniref:Uncharacterized protein n=1 Tax=Haloferula helveola TaxID=490095 RepID=A0ABM7RJ12_9BACT|nr:hypothetical protein HAHE_37070 [Haloferula helveola]